MFVVNLLPSLYSIKSNIFATLSCSGWSCVFHLVHTTFSFHIKANCTLQLAVWPTPQYTVKSPPTFIQVQDVVDQWLWLWHKYGSAIMDKLQKNTKAWDSHKWMRQHDLSQYPTLSQPYHNMLDSYQQQHMWLSIVSLWHAFNELQIRVCAAVSWHHLTQDC